MSCETQCPSAYVPLSGVTDEERERESNAYRLRDGAGHCTADEFGQSTGLVMLRISPDKLNFEEFVRRKVESDIGSDACGKKRLSRRVDIAENVIIARTC